MIEIFTPFGVGSEYSWMRSGCLGGHLPVMAKAESSFIAGVSDIVKWTAARLAGERSLGMGYDSGELID
jgi:hypothetical protein